MRFAAAAGLVGKCKLLTLGLCFLFSKTGTLTSEMTSSFAIIPLATLRIVFKWLLRERS